MALERHHIGAMDAILSTLRRNLPETPTCLLLSAFIARSLHTRLPSTFLRSFNFAVTASGGTIEPRYLLCSFPPGLEADGAADRASVFTTSRISTTPPIWPISPIAPGQTGYSAWQTVHEFEAEGREKNVCVTGQAKLRNRSEVGGGNKISMRRIGQAGIPLVGVVCLLRLGAG